jgi:LPS export ABC transporter protein LptC
VWRLEAARGDIHDRQNRVGLREMTVDFFDENGVFLSKLRADSGSVDSRTEDMEAIGDVRVESEEGSVLRTSRLRWDSGGRLMRTDREVEITRGDDRVRGRGFEGDPGLARFTILERVSATVRDGAERGTPEPGGR